MNLNIVFLLTTAFWLAGCASITPQSDAFFKEKPQIKGASQIEVPFINQDIGQCGPATLTMVLQYTGKNISVEEIAPQVITPNKKGSLQSDMISATRRQGLMAVIISGFNSVIAEVAAGHPVIIFENLGISWIPQWHYAVVTGYDLQKKTLTLQSGPNHNEQISFDEFELSWKLADYWGLLILKPDQLSASADELAHLQAASALEQVNKLIEAKTAYLTILTRWPQSLTSYVGLGNIFYKTRDYKSAVAYLKKAAILFPNSDVVRHNLEVAEQAL
jgi:hypothetical protein